MIRAHHLLKPGGLIGFIVPKPFTYNSNWTKIRELTIDSITDVIDCGKVWKDVKLEMTIYLSEKGSQMKYYRTQILRNNEFLDVGRIEKSLSKEFGFLINGVSSEEVELAKSLRASGKAFGDIVSNRRGGMLQQKLTESGELMVLGGKQLKKFRVNLPPKGTIRKEDLSDQNAYLIRNSILVQNIVAHINKPFPRIVIIATTHEELDPKKYVILDTINQLENKSEYSSKFILGVLNSDLISWYVYKFIFGNAIRTMHFDSTATSKIPFPSISLNVASDREIHDELSRVVDLYTEALERLERAKTQKEKSTWENRITGYKYKMEELTWRAFGLDFNSNDLLR
jgi:hypothetical protein